MKPLLGVPYFGTYNWVLVKGFSLLSYQYEETLLFTIDPYFGNLN